MEQRIQIATHFTIDPAKQVLGSIKYPDKVTVTLAIGEHLEPQKINFDVAFTTEQKEKIEEHLNTLIIESSRTAKPVNISTSTPSDEDEEISLF